MSRATPAAEGPPCPKFKPEDVVWAKLGNTPWWPAKVRPIERAPVKVRKYYRPNMMLLQFMGDKTWNWLKHKDLLPFEENRKR